MLAVALLYRLACALGLSRAVALLGAALLALSPYAIWHSQDARMYNMSLALTLASTWLAVEAMRRPCWRYWGAYILVSWLALHTHYFAAFILLAQNVFFIGEALLVADRRRRVWQWLAAQLAIVGLYVPWLLAVRSILMGYRGNVDSPALGVMVQRTLSVFAAGESSPTQARALVAGLCAALMMLGLARLLAGNARTRRAAALLVLYLAIPVMATWLSSRNRPIFNERYLVAAVPACYLLLAAIISPIYPMRHAALWQGVKVLGTAGLAVLVLGASISLYRYYTDPTYGKTLGWRELARAVDQLSAGLPADQVRVAQNFPDPTLWYYYPWVGGPPRTAPGRGRSSRNAARSAWAGGPRGAPCHPSAAIDALVGQRGHRRDGSGAGVYADRRATGWSLAGSDVHPTSAESRARGCCFPGWSGPGKRDCGT